MAKKISQLTQATQVKSDDVTVIVQDGETKKLPLNMMVTKQDIENKKVAGLAKLDEIEATYENDTYTPTIAVKNKSSVKVGEGDGVDYSANVMDGHVKSAILKGNTLVNIIQSVKVASSLSTDYNLSFIDKTKTYFIKFNAPLAITKIGFLVSNSEWNVAIYDVNSSNGYIKLKPDESKDIIGLRVRYDGNTDSSYIPTLNVVCVEYQQDMENWDIPYFTGMQSVRMPVLCTTGKNLFNIEHFANIENWDSPNGSEQPYFSYKLNLKPNTKYTFSRKDLLKGENIYLALTTKQGVWDSVGGLIHPAEVYNKTKLTVETNDTGVMYLNLYKANTELVNTVNCLTEAQVEESSVATTYEPFKTNILTVNEPIELRGIGDVQDTLDLLTGEVTERIGEIVLDGSENWSRQGVSQNNSDLGIYYSTKALPNTIFNTNNVLCDKFKTSKTMAWHSSEEDIYVSISTYGLKICFDERKLESTTVEGFKKWLSENTPTIQYPLVEKPIKTVDLMPSGTHPSTTPYCWKNGHIQLSSSGLLPSLEYSVVTSRAGQINQNATMIVKNDKRIFDLEILLAGGLVNTTYQALTLQNQVETGLSKVSLSSEAEPDYLLYHMIMKLIEEKAYKLDDLTEKVSVFYLYGKLSDEQFETIYSALYPFVEDEIVEEPVVEELPEVVEDEVIM